MPNMHLTMKWNVLGIILHNTVSLELELCFKLTSGKFMYRIHSILLLSCFWHRSCIDSYTVCVKYIQNTSFYDEN